MVRHPDFEKIHSAFLAHYSEDPQFGESRYSEWVKSLGLDETASYYDQALARRYPRESFQWAQLLLQFVKEDKEAKYYKVEALFPLESMNGVPYTRDELLQAARTLAGKPNYLNHDPKHELREIEIVASQYESDTVECLVRVLKGSPAIGMIDRKEIVNVSVETEWSHGVVGQGLVFTGLGWLTKDHLPGVPLTRIMPVERIAESFQVEQFSGHKGLVKEKIKEQSDVFCVFCENPADFFVSVCQSCVDKFSLPADGSAGQAVQSGVEKLEEKDLDAIAEKVAAKISEKESAVVEKLKTDLAAANAKVAEAEGKTKTAETLAADAASKLEAANKTVENLRKQVPGGGLLKDPPKMMLISEHVAVLEGLLPGVMVERSSMGMQYKCQEIRSAIFKAKEKLKGAA
jgi:hypothetical protein